MSKPILFYSKRDQRSINLWNQLSKNNILNTFVKICVDNNNKIPKMITSVPSIFIKTRGVISGAAIPMYLNSLQSPNTNLSIDNNGNPSKHPSFQKPINSNLNNKEELCDFNPVEMSDQWSDSYSFIKESSDPISFSFQLLNNNEGNLIQNTNDKPDSNDLNQRKTDFQSRLDNLQQQRNQI